MTHTKPWREAIERVPLEPAAQAERHLFRELNPNLAQTPILKGEERPIRQAAVMIPIIDRPEDPQVLLTVRPQTMPSHAGEISLPGGGLQSDDDGMIGTALRETHEEIGVSPSNISVVGEFGVHFGGRGFAVTPVLGIVDAGATIIPCEREVEEVFEVPLRFLVDPRNHLVEVREFGGTSYNMYAVPYHDGNRAWHIWGLTAGILHTLAKAYTCGGLGK
ncbi:MAG: CoA pyrophosphatase [Pseudomonadota bacterium]